VLILAAWMGAASAKETPFIQSAFASSTTAIITTL
jgi:hypothetical protein